MTGLTGLALGESISGLLDMLDSNIMSIKSQHNQKPLRILNLEKILQPSLVVVERMHEFFVREVFLYLILEPGV